MIPFIRKLTGNGIPIRLRNIVQTSADRQVGFFKAPGIDCVVLYVKISAIVPNLNIPHIRMLTRNKIHGERIRLSSRQA